MLEYGRKNAHSRVELSNQMDYLLRTGHRLHVTVDDGLSHARIVPRRPYFEPQPVEQAIDPHDLAVAYAAMDPKLSTEQLAETGFADLAEQIDAVRQIPINGAEPRHGRIVLCVARTDEPEVMVVTIDTNARFAVIAATQHDPNNLVEELGLDALEDVELEDRLNESSTTLANLVAQRIDAHMSGERPLRTHAPPLGRAKFHDLNFGVPKENFPFRVELFVPEPHDYERRKEGLNNFDLFKVFDRLRREFTGRVRIAHSTARLENRNDLEAFIRELGQTRPVSRRDGDRIRVSRGGGSWTIDPISYAEEVPAELKKPERELVVNRLATPTGRRRSFSTVFEHLNLVRWRIRGSGTSGEPADSPQTAIIVEALRANDIDVRDYTIDSPANPPSYHLDASFEDGGLSAQTGPHLGLEKGAYVSGYQAVVFVARMLDLRGVPCREEFVGRAVVLNENAYSLRDRYEGDG